MDEGINHVSVSSVLAIVALYVRMYIFSFVLVLHRILESVF